MIHAAHQRGVALLVALLVVALATLLIAALLDAGQLSMAHTRNLLREQQADAYAKGLEAYAAHVLVRDMEQGQIDTGSDIWAFPLPPTPVAGGSISATMRDMNGCFNLNNLLLGQLQNLWLARFERLLANLHLPPGVADSVLDWLDADRQRSERGAEDGVYLARQPAYRAANRGFSEISELRLVAAVDARVYAALAPHVCALPTATELNLNTASIPVLMSLADGITVPLAARVYQDGQASFPSVEAALSEWRRAGARIDPAQSRGLGVHSEYFRARASIELGGLEFIRRSLIQRHAGIRVLARDRGAR